jgi:hypothetical protein
MSFQQVYQAQFAKPLINQLIAIIQRDQDAALAIINAARGVDGNGPLDPIAEFHKGPALRTAFPWLFIEFGPTVFTPTTAVTTRASTVTMVANLDTGQFDSEMAQEDAHDYGRMLDLIISGVGPCSANNLADWINPLPIAHETVPSGMTAPNTQGAVKNIFIEAHVPGKVAAEGTDVPVMRISLNIQAELEEI